MKRTYKRNPSLVDIFNQYRNIIIGGAVAVGGWMWWNRNKNAEAAKKEQSIAYKKAEAVPTYVKPTTKVVKRAVDER